jgi:hypothetical protein
MAAIKSKLTIESRLRFAELNSITTYMEKSSRHMFFICLAFLGEDQRDRANDVKRRNFDSEMPCDNSSNDHRAVNHFFNLMHLAFSNYFRRATRARVAKKHGKPSMIMISSVRR